MAGAVISLTLEGKLARRFDELKKMGKNLAPAMRNFQRDMFRSTALNFRSKGRMDEAKHLWPALSPTTIKRRRAAQQRGTKMLRASGRLFLSVTGWTGDSFHAIGKDFLQIGTVVEYADRHQQGGVFGNRLFVRETVDIPQHKRTMLVRKGKIGSQAERKRRLKKIRASRAMSEAERTRRRRKGKKKRGEKLVRDAFDAELRKMGERVIKPKKRGPNRKRKRFDMVKRKVTVLAHKQQHAYVIPARPFLRFHKKDIKRAMLRIKQYLKLEGV